MTVPRTMICEWREPIAYPLARLISDLREAIERTEAHVAVHSASRLYAWLDALEKLQREDHRSVAHRIAHTLLANVERIKREGESVQGEAWAQLPFQDCFRSLLEARTFVHVVQNLEAKLQPIHWKELVQGKLRPEEDKQNTPHRDRLLELYVASAAEAAGMEVRLSEPDVVVSLNGKDYGIAAKRVKSRRQLIRRAGYGIDQIVTSTNHGLLFLDVSNLMNEDTAAMRWIGDFPAKESGTVHPHLMRLASEYPLLRQFIDDGKVDGIVLRHAAPALVLGSHVPASLETWSPIVEHPSPTTMAVFGAMLDALSPPPRPQPGIGPSGFAPSEFSFAHP